MAGGKDAAAKHQQLTRLKDTHNGSIFVTAPAYHQSSTRGNVPAAARRTSNPLVAAGQNHGHARHGDTLRTTHEQRGAVFTRQGFQQLPSGPIPTTPRKTAPPAGKPAPAPAESGNNLARPPSFRQEVGPPSPRLEPGVVQEIGGRDEVPEGAVAFVFVYMCVVVFAMAALLLYVYRSLTSGPPGVELSTDETSTPTVSTLVVSEDHKQSVVSEERELGHGTTWAVPGPLGSRCATTTWREPKARGHGGQESTENTSTVARTNDLGEGNVSRTNMEENEAGRTAATVATPDDDWRSFDLVVLAAPGYEKRPSNWSYGDQESKEEGHLLRRGLRRRVG
ncbi:hypothetical protein MTO96_030950 [Rhipicephalus appendiculatus]